MVQYLFEQKMVCNITSVGADIVSPAESHLFWALRYSVILHVTLCCDLNNAVTYGVRMSQDYWLLWRTTVHLTASQMSSLLISEEILRYRNVCVYTAPLKRLKTFFKNPHYATSLGLLDLWTWASALLSTLKCSFGKERKYVWTLWTCKMLVWTCAPLTEAVTALNHNLDPYPVLFLSHLFHLF